MEKYVKKFLSVFILICMFISPAINVFTGWVASAATVDDLNKDSIFLKQETAITCTLSSAAMMMRRTAIVAGYTDWEEITEPNIRETAWIEGLGLRWNYTCYNMSVGHGYFEDVDNKLFMLELLEKYPQGVVIYNTGKQGQNHAVFLCDYDEETDTFFVADPASSAPEGRIPFSESTIAGETQDEKIANISAYWYVSSPTVTLEDGEYTASDNSPIYDPDSDTVAFDSSKVSVHKYFVVSSDSSQGAALRYYPSGSSSVYKNVMKGTILYITYFGQNNFGADWYKTNTGYYIFNDNIVPFDEYSAEIVKFDNTAEVTSGTYKTASVADSKTPLRLEPSEGNNIVAYVDNDTQLYITHSGVNSVGASWLKTQEGYFVKASEMKFVSSQKLENTDFSGSYSLVQGDYSSVPIEDVQDVPDIVPEKYRITATALNIRKSAVDGEVLVSIPKDTVVEVTAVVSGWGKTEYMGYEGWISLSYAEKVTDEISELKIDSVKLSSTGIHTGDTITCTVDVNTDMKCMYKFSVFNDSGNKVDANSVYSTKNTFEYTTTTAGNFYFSVDVLCGDERTVSGFSGNFTVNDKLQLGSIRSNVDEYIYAFEEIVWTVETVSRSDNAVYTYSLYCDDELVLERESKIDEFVYTPKQSGSYVLYATLSDDFSSSNEIKASEVIVYDALSIESITTDLLSVSVGNEIVCSVAALGGTGEYQYCFTVFKGSKIIINGTFSDSHESKIAFKEAGTYKIFCAVKDSGNMIVSEFSDDIEVFDITIGDVDCDGKVTAMDSRLVLRHSAGMENLSNDVISAADVNFDKKVNAADARLILRSAARIEVIG